MIFLAVFWTIYIPFIAYDSYTYYIGPWVYFWASTCFFCVLVNANGMLGHAARYSVSLRAIPMLLLRIACIASLIGLIANYIFECNIWWSYNPDPF